MHKGEGKGGDRISYNREKTRMQSNFEFSFLAQRPAKSLLRVSFGHCSTEDSSSGFPTTPRAPGVASNGAFLVFRLVERPSSNGGAARGSSSLGKATDERRFDGFRRRKDLAIGFPRVFRGCTRLPPRFGKERRENVRRCTRDCSLSSVPFAGTKGGRERGTRRLVSILAPTAAAPLSVAASAARSAASKSAAVSVTRRYVRAVFATGGSVDFPLAASVILLVALIRSAVVAKRDWCVSLLTRRRFLALLLSRRSFPR